MMLQNMRRGHRSIHTMRTRWMAGMMVGSLFAALAGVIGCGEKKAETPPPETPPPVQTGQPEYPGAIKATISAGYAVSPGTINISKSRRDVVQWENTSGDTLLVIFKDTSGIDGEPLGELIPPNSFSAPFHGCLTCVNGTYSYKLHRRVGSDWKEVAQAGGPPDVPEVAVGD